MVVVPPGRPRTKPRALNFALGFARGAYIVVFDAEDVPDPGQLRRALALLRSDPDRLGCVQAKLAIYNTRELAHGAIRAGVRGAGHCQTWEEAPATRWLKGWMQTPRERRDYRKLNGSKLLAKVIPCIL